MPKLKFKPKSHTIGDNTDIFITACNSGEPAICIKCNDVAAFIINQMYPEHKPRKDIIPLVMTKFNCTEEDATEAVETVISKLTHKESEVNEE